VQMRWLFCTCKDKGCWCLRLVKVEFKPALTMARDGDMGPCPECFEHRHMAGEPPWYYKSLIESQRDFIEREGVWHE
jgi:hypothetical protein